jgi:RNA-directed DNA polymerase
LKKAPGIDGETITEAFDKYLKDKDAFCRCIREGRWKPYPVRRVEIPKASGGSRPLGIPTVYDRVVQRAIQQVIEPMIDPFFSEHSYGFRPKRSVHQAARRVRHLIDQGHGYIVDFDLSKFFDTVNHEKLMSILRRIVRDEALLSLIWRFLRAGVMVEMIVQATDEGVPQGGPLSPLLANTFLHLLDFELERRGLQFVRYADDFVIMCRSKRAAYRVLRSVSRYLEGMDLKVNLTKSKVVNATQLVSLGCAFPAGGIRISDQKVESFKQRIFCCLERCPDTTMDLHVARMLKFLSGWRAHYGQLDDKTQLIKLRKWYCGIVRNTMDNYKGSGPDPVAVALHAWPWIPTSHSIHQNHDPDKPGHRRNDIAQQTNNAQAAFHSLDEDALPAGVEVS